MIAIARNTLDFSTPVTSSQTCSLGIQISFIINYSPASLSIHLPLAVLMFRISFITGYIRYIQIVIKKKLRSRGGDVMSGRASFFINVLLHTRRNTLHFLCIFLCAINILRNEHQSTFIQNLSDVFCLQLIFFLITCCPHLPYDCHLVLQVLSPLNGYYLAYNHLSFDVALGWSFLISIRIPCLDPAQLYLQFFYTISTTSSMIHMPSQSHTFPICSPSCSSTFILTFSLSLPG